MASLESHISSTAIGSLTIALEGLEDGAVASGLPRESARSFVRQALLGSVLLIDDLTDSPATLKDRVASPGGTTIEGLAALEDHGVRGALLRAVELVAQGAQEGR